MSEKIKNIKFNVSKEYRHSWNSNSFNNYFLEHDGVKFNLLGLVVDADPRKYKNIPINSNYEDNIAAVERILMVAGDYFLTKLQEAEDNGVGVKDFFTEKFNKLTVRDLSYRLELFLNVMNNASVNKTDEELLHFYMGAYNTDATLNVDDYHKDFEKIKEKGRKIHKILSVKRVNSLFDLANIFDANFMHLDSSDKNYLYVKNVFKYSPILFNNDVECIEVYNKLALLSCAGTALNWKFDEEILNTKLRDYHADLTMYSEALKYTNSYSYNLVKIFPNTSPKFASFILDVEVGDIIEASRKTGASTTVTNAIKIIEDIRVNKEELYTNKDCMENALELSTLIQKKINESNPNAVNMVIHLSTSEKIYDNYRYYWGVRILMDYFKNHNKTYEEGYEYYHMATYVLNTIFGPANGWFRGPSKNIENIFKELYKNFDAEYIINLIDGVRLSDKNFTESQWRSIIESSDMYTDAPVEWVLELI